MSFPTAPLTPFLTPHVRGNTPVSPLSEELFADFLDAPPRTTPLPADLCWIFEDDDDEEPAACTTPQLNNSGSNRSVTPPSVAEVIEVMSRALSARPSPSPTPSKYELLTEKEPPATVRAMDQGGRLPRLAPIQPAPLNVLHREEQSVPVHSFKRQVSEIPLDRCPLFCSSDQQVTMYGGPPGEAIDPQNHISRFVEYMTNVPTQAGLSGALLCSPWATPNCDPIFHTEPIFEALSKAQHVIEVETRTITHVTKDIGGRMEERKIDLSRYFLPSMSQGYLEIHAKDVCAGMNPVRERLGQMEGMSPFMVLVCNRPRESEIRINNEISDECHTTSRTVYLLKNRLIRGTFKGRRARVVTGEWLVGGVNKQWGMTLEEAKDYWSMM